MIFVVIRKMFQNKWLSTCLLLGFILVVATVSSIPMFTRGASFNEYMKRTCQHLYFEEIFSDFRNEYGNKLEKIT